MGLASYVLLWVVVAVVGVVMAVSKKYFRKRVATGRHDGCVVSAKQRPSAKVNEQDLWSTQNRMRGGEGGKVSTFSNPGRFGHDFPTPLADCECKALNSPTQMPTGVGF